MWRYLARWATEASIICELASYPLNFRPSVSAFMVGAHLCGGYFGEGSMDALDNGLQSLQTVLEAGAACAASDPIGQAVQQAGNGTSAAPADASCEVIIGIAGNLAQVVQYAIGAAPGQPVDGVTQLEAELQALCRSQEVAGSELLTTACQAGEALYSSLTLSRCYQWYQYDMAYLWAAGLVLLVAAYLGLKYNNRNKQV